MSDPPGDHPGVLIFPPLHFAIVSNGPLACTRNPLDLSVLSLLAGIGVAAASR